MDSTRDRSVRNSTLMTNTFSSETSFIGRRPGRTTKRTGASFPGTNGRHGENKLSPHAQDQIAGRQRCPERLADQLAPPRLLFRREETDDALQGRLLASILRAAGRPRGRLRLLLNGAQRFALGGRQGERLAHRGILERPQAALLQEHLVQS